MSLQCDNLSGELQDQWSSILDINFLFFEAQNIYFVPNCTGRPAASAFDHNRTFLALFAMSIDKMKLTFESCVSKQNNKLMNSWLCLSRIPNEPRREKTSRRGFRPGPTQTGLYKLRKELEA